MSTRTLSRINEAMPSVIDDFFKPWNDWFENAGVTGRILKMPAVNITESKDNYQVSLAAPGLHKDDFKIDVEGNMLSISCEKEGTKEQAEKKIHPARVQLPVLQSQFSIAGRSEPGKN